jgi:hypothetical protein
MKMAGTDVLSFRLLLAIVAAVQFQRLGTYFQSNAGKAMRRHARQR